LVTAGSESFNTNKTYVFETVGNYQFVNVSISGYSISDVPFSISYKIEKGSKVIVDNTKEITENSEILNENYNVRFDQ